MWNIHCENFKCENINFSKEALKNLQKVVLANGNIFEELLYTTKYASLGEITKALYSVGGQYRRAM